MGAEFKVKVTTTHEGDGAKKAEEELKQLTETAATTQNELKGLEAQTGTLATVLGKLGTKLGSFAIGTVFTAGMTLVTALLAKAGGEIIEILRLLGFFPDASKKVDTVADSFASTKRTADEAKASVQQLTQVFNQASQAMETLRKKQDELGDADLAANLAGIDILEALGPSRQGISPDQARLRRASLRMDNARQKNAGERTQISGEQKIIYGQQAASRANLKKEQLRQQPQDELREELLARASQLLSVPIDLLRDPDVFDREFQAAMNQTLGAEIPGEMERDRETPEQIARRKELEPLAPLSTTALAASIGDVFGDSYMARKGGLLRSRRLGVRRATEQIHDVNAVAGEKLPELDRERQLVDRREATGNRSEAKEFITALDNGNAGSASAQQIREALQKFGAIDAQNARQIIDTVNQLISQQQKQGRDLDLLNSKFRNRL
jgi:hypothetical protein